MKCYNTKRQFKVKLKNDLFKHNELTKNLILLFKQNLPKEELINMSIEDNIQQVKNDYKENSILLLKDWCNKEVLLKDIEELNKVYSLRNKKFPYKNSSGERPKKLAKLVREEEQVIKSQRTRNIKCIDNIRKNIKPKKNSSSEQRINRKEIINQDVVAKSRNKIPDFKTPC